MTGVRGFLKYKCVTPSGEEFYKCWNSNVIYQVTKQTCAVQLFTGICEDDPQYYQLCGFIPCDHNIEDQYGYCGNYICNTYNPYTYSISDPSVRDGETCDGRVYCHGNKADELNCEDSDDEEQFQCSYGNRTINVSEVCDGINDCKYGTEEINCNHTYGVTCKVTYSGITYDRWIPPYWVCNGYSSCDGGEGEEDCANSTHHARWCKLRTKIDYLIERQLCDTTVSQTCVGLWIIGVKITCVLITGNNSIAPTLSWIVRLNILQLA